MNNAGRRTVGQQSARFANAVQAMINRSCIIDFGVVLSVPASGVVRVGISAATSKSDVQVITCVYANIASAAITVNIVPKEGDKVIVLYPKRFHPEMFNVDNNDVIIDENSYGYNLMSGIAIPLNQYRKNQHNNVLNIDEEGIEVKLNYGDGDKTINIITGSDGSITLNSNDKASLNIDGDGNVSIESNGNSVSVENNGEITISGKAEIKIDSSGNVTVDAKTGKVSIKNSMADLTSILSGMLQTLNTSLATAGSPAAQTVVPGQFAKQVIDLNLLMQ